MPSSAGPVAAGGATALPAVLSVNAAPEFWTVKPVVGPDRKYQRTAVAQAASTTAWTLIWRLPPDSTTFPDAGDGPVSPVGVTKVYASVYVPAVRPPPEAAAALGAVVGGLLLLYWPIVRSEVKEYGMSVSLPWRPTFISLTSAAMGSR